MGEKLKICPRGLWPSSSGLEESKVHVSRIKLKVCEIGTTAPRKAAEAKRKDTMCDKIIDAPIQFIFAMYFVSISLKNC